jgi:hypothetical protein
MTNKNKEYAKKYWARKDVKERKKLQQRERYPSDKVQNYEYARRRTPKSRFMRAKTNAKARKKTFTIGLEEYTILIDNPCKYCGCDISEETGSGLDRIDNDVGYEPGNCNPCCKDCNRRRHRSMAADVFEDQSEKNNYRKKTRQST